MPVYSHMSEGRVPVLLLGLKPQGLFLLRELSRAGFEVHAIDSMKTPAFYSKYGFKYLVSSNAEFLSLLSKLHKRFGSDTRCYISSGALLDCVVERMPQLYEMYEVYPRPLASVDVLRDKMSTYLVAKESGIDCPETFTLELVDRACEFCSNGRKLIAKWNREFTGAGSTPKFKTRIIDTPMACTELKKMLSKDEERHLILQRFIESSQDYNVSYLGYYVDGKCLAGFLAQQIRQFPQGITSYLREYAGPCSNTILAQARTIFRELKYTGFGEAEFKFEKDYSNAYLLEVNPRTCGWSSVLSAKYPELHRLFEQPLCDVPLTGSSSWIRWANIVRDAQAIVHGARNRKAVHRCLVDFGSWARLKSIDEFDPRDLLPFLMHPIQVLIAGGRRRT